MDRQDVTLSPVLSPVLSAAERWLLRVSAVLMAKTCCLGIKDPYEEGNWFDDLSFDTPPPPPPRGKERPGRSRHPTLPELPWRDHLL